MSASIAIVLRTDRIKKNGEIPMCLRFTLNRKKLEVSLKRYLSPKTSITLEKLNSLTPSERLQDYHWNAEKEQLTKGADNYVKINYILTKEKKRAVDILLKYKLYGKHITKELFRKDVAHSFIKL